MYEWLLILQLLTKSCGTSYCLHICFPLPPLSSASLLLDAGNKWDLHWRNVTEISFASCLKKKIINEIYFWGFVLVLFVFFFLSKKLYRVFCLRMFWFCFLKMLTFWIEYTLVSFFSTIFLLMSKLPLFGITFSSDVLCHKKGFTG